MHNPKFNPRSHYRVWINRALFTSKMRHPELEPESPNILDITQGRGSRINLQKPQILRDDGMGLRLSTPLWHELGYLISWSRLLNSQVLKKSARVMLKPSHSILMVVIWGFLLCPLMML